MAHDPDHLPTVIHRHHQGLQAHLDADRRLGPG
jgi:hypothetical protein